MVVRLACGALQGVEAFRVDLEVDMVRQGLPSFVMVGLAEGAVREAKERVFAALRSCGFRLPSGRITVNLAPADRRKVGSGYDLPLALALLAAAGLLPEERLRGWFLVGELSLSGAIKPVSGVLPLALLARREQARGIITAPENALEAAITGLPAYAPQTLSEAVAFLLGEEPLAPCKTASNHFESAPSLLDFAEVKGQEHAKRAFEIAAAGAHNVLLVGSPGSGKTMLAQRLPSILPPLSFEESLEVTTVYSVSGLLDRTGLVSQRPFRAPHHTVSEIALVGGGTYPRPGEVSLAHRGVLFLDELPEYGKSTLDVLRQPLEEGTVSVSRAAQSVTFPADCMLVAAMNPCPCGYAMDSERQCVCTASQVQRYRSRLSGPLLDRIDLHIHVPAVPYEDLQRASATTSTMMRDRVLAARERQRERYADSPHCRTNADLSGALLERYCRLGEREHGFLREAVQRLALSARAYTRILRISRTIADLAGAETLTVAHLAEAVNCRILDRERY